ncbi:Peroxisomal 2,4-dienoyl-CoA reductase SPS19 [Golovinomyces cichoracearum]|uniref:2,4-dienoyl-CoA reductase [(3E)-enoyl-CoA-producing] n=1 Tax=Golovinomyces cichoracearum TaxID=62708 RepID=A0A420IIE7_9PEZI|nr:Peroxisomal 2,4-dienoyl-CoA reductase SPS19 [Golovinomyces cichoracearum]
MTLKSAPDSKLIIRKTLVMSLEKSEYLSNVWRSGIFDGKVVFCTGGAGTICSAQVRALVNLGANACIVGRNVPKTEQMAASIATARKDAKVIGIGSIDVRKIEELEQAALRCVQELGAIDFVIAGAAGNFIAPITELSANGFKSVVDIDTIGSYNTLKATLPYLIESAARNPNTSANSSTGGRIIFISATFHFTGVPLQAHAAVAKAGVDALSASAAIELGPRGITSNVITPGPINNTEGMKRLGDQQKEASSEAFKKIPLQRYGTVKEVSDATVFLFSDTGNYVNGSVLVVDGGSWRMHSAPITKGTYPDYLLDNSLSRMSAGKKSKL